jgi:dTDP-glucose 4,6-dehydratase
MNILITGGAGFLGTQVTRTLLDAGHSVCVIDKMGEGYRHDFPTINPEVKFTALECESPVLENVLLNMIEQHGMLDAVIVLHAESHVDRSICDAVPFVDSNVKGTVCIFDALVSISKGYDCPMPKVLLFSTDEVLGESFEPATEDHSILFPKNPYSASKAAQELFFLSYCNTFGLSGVITRCCNIYGPGQATEKFIPRSMSLLSHGVKLKLYGKGEESRQWIYVSDVADIVVKITEHLKTINSKTVDVFHISGDDYIQNHNLAKMMCELYGKSMEDGVEFVENRLGHDKSYLLDSEKARRFFNWNPKVRLVEGLLVTKTYYEGSFYGRQTL